MLAKFTLDNNDLKQVTSPIHILKIKKETPLEKSSPSRLSVQQKEE
jgi:hypothetical protein